MRHSFDEFRVEPYIRVIALLWLALDAGPPLVGQQADPIPPWRQIIDADTTSSARDSTPEHIGLETVTEEIVTRFIPANNGAGPLWCYGSPLLVRNGDEVYVSIIETGQNVPPLCNTRWQLWRRSRGRWEMLHQEKEFRQREPCPLTILPGQGLFLSSNPSLTAPGTRYRACEPTIIGLSTTDPDGAPVVEKPSWSTPTHFTDHSYRGIAADAKRGELLVLNIDATSSAQHVSFRDKHGNWQAKGKIDFPIRSAYPQVALRDGAAHVLAIGDIREPVAEWQKLKFEKLGREWDYVFRRLFYTYSDDVTSDDVTTKHFKQPLEIDSVERTAGHITNFDLHVDQNGAAHVLYLKRPHMYEFIRDKYFPGRPMTCNLEYAVIDGGVVVTRRTVASSVDEDFGWNPSYGRFHVSSPGHLYVVVAGSRTGQEEANFVLGVSPPRRATRIDLQHPFRRFYTNTTRGGSRASDRIDLFGTSDDPPNLRYASIRLVD